MQLYKYRGYDHEGAKVHGELAANSIEDVERKMAAQEVTVVAILPAGSSKNRSNETSESAAPRRLKGASDADAAGLLRDMAVMAETGVPFVEALDALVNSTQSAALKASLKNLKIDIVGGKGLSTALKGSGVFPAVVCDMVKVAEEGGRLDKALSSAATYMERTAELRKKVINAMIYPAVLTTISFSTVVILVVFVLPRFATIFSRMNAEIPASTQFLLKLSDTIRAYPLLILLGIVGVFFAFRMAWSLPSTQRVITRFLLKVPILGELMRRLALSRAFQSMATLLGSNVALLSALEHGARVAGNPVIKDALLRARVGVEHGAPLSESFAESGVFPSMVVQMVHVGEKSGRLSALMQSMASHMEADVDGRIKALVSIVEPVMIVVMGVVVGAITLSVIIPLYSVVQNIK